ncbi:hypothetical protein [Deinococcus knuensis]|uniref:Uncharacterized protein n=1 Tax=Deinococcus knuensis TaxID=1837380 RepID=A0ABQ2SUB3_9DEIO|nr:hypothetical protein [Deinococcus knuensis]GGS38104.1 hypothetical protein GCM10008961_32060 [Deinococcus knuensis]
MTHHDAPAPVTAAPVTAGEVTPEVLSLARLISAHPNAARALQASIARQQAARAAAQRPTPTLSCPHCGAPGIVYLTLPGQDGPREFRHKPSDCCQDALRDAAELALHYALNPNNDPTERVENADLYAALKASITDPALLRELDTHEVLLADIERRVTGLTRAQGGVDQ